MLARRKLARRVDDALSSASPLALADAMDAHVSRRSPEDLRGMIARSSQRMDQGERAQLELYLNPDDTDDLLGYRFSAFLRQNPRAIAALDPDALDAILHEIGEVPPIPHERRRLPARTAWMVALVVAIAILPLLAQYAHQRGLIEGLSEPSIPAPIVPFVQAVSMHRAAAAVPKHRHPAAIPHRVRHHAAVAVRTHPRPVHRVALRKPTPHRATSVAWKFDPGNNPYFNRSRWHNPYRGDTSPFAERARLSVRSYLHAIVAGNLPAALAHLGMPPGSGTTPLAELPIVSPRTNVSIVGSSRQPNGNERVQVSIVTSGRAYFEIFDVAHDGPAARIVDHYYIPVNRRAQIASRVTRTE